MSLLVQLKFYYNLFSLGSMLLKTQNSNLAPEVLPVRGASSQIDIASILFYFPTQVHVLALTRRFPAVNTSTSCLALSHYVSYVFS